ncbi:MAG: FAD:protein FMN transferase [Dehalococcoidia bacterium]
MTTVTHAASARERTVHYRIAMDTTVIVETISALPASEVEARVERAFGWFTQVEACCSRFDPESELSRLCDRPGEPVKVSNLLGRALAFALAVAADSGGAFDPTIGDSMVRAGFSENYRSAEVVVPRSADRPNFQDVAFDSTGSEVTLLRKLTLDLGAVAKGLAIDLAARELEGLDGFVINAGGDMYASGINALGEPWAIGVRDPRDLDMLADTFYVGGAAVCTSGDYERTSAANPTRHHLLDPRTRVSAQAAASVTVIAPTAMAADALATAAFVLGPRDGMAFLERNGVDGLIITPDGERHETPDLEVYR